MNKIYELQSALLKVIDQYEKLVTRRDYTADWERIHIVSCAKIGYMIAEKRGQDPVLAACACTIHDFGRIVTGRQEGHAGAGFEPVKQFLKDTGLFSDEEVHLLATSAKNHSKKEEIGTAIEEIVKDADVLDFYQYGVPFARPEQKKRAERILGRKL